VLSDAEIAAFALDNRHPSGIRLGGKSRNMAGRAVTVLRSASGSPLYLVEARFSTPNLW